MTRLLLALGLLATLLLAAVPTAEAGVASTLQLFVETPKDAMKPLTEIASLEGTVTYGYNGPASKGALRPTKVTLTATAPPWAVVSISPSSLFIPLTKHGVQETEVGTFKLLVTTLADAPAFATDKIVVNAVAEANEQLDGATSTTEIPIQADYFGLIDARVEGPIRHATPQKAVSFPLTIKNFGNAQSKITFEVNATKGLTAPVPLAMTLDSRTGGKITEGIRFVDVQAPFSRGYVNEAGEIRVTVRSAYALDPSKTGDEVVLSLLLTTKGFHTPGPEPLLLVVGLAGLAAVARPPAWRRP